jgi:hypothetical protein
MVKEVLQVYLSIPTTSHDNNIGPQLDVIPIASWDLSTRVASCCAGEKF